MGSININLLCDCMFVVTLEYSAEAYRKILDPMFDLFAHVFDTTTDEHKEIRIMIKQN